MTEPTNHHGDYAGLRVGVLALQGDFAKHQQVLEKLGATAPAVRRSADLSGLNGIVLPGGESTTLLKLLDDELRRVLVEMAAGGFPLLATCAGAILIANSVTNPAQPSLKLLDISISRNAYGRQRDSFATAELTWTSDGRRTLEQHLGATGTTYGSRTLEGIFIRAPKITATGRSVQTLVEHGMEPVLVNSGNVFAATFHPELNESASAVHELFCAVAREFKPV